MGSQPTILHIPADRVNEGDTYVTCNQGWNYSAIAGRTSTDTTITLHIQDSARADVWHPIASWRPAVAAPTQMVPILVDPTHLNPIPFEAVGARV